MLLKDKLIVAVDFDGTMVITQYPFIEKANERLIDFLKAWQESGNIVILNTCRHDDELMDACSYMYENYNFLFDYVNENVPEVIEKYGDTRKIAADIYVDDKLVNLTAILTALDNMKGDIIKKSEGDPNAKLAPESINTIKKGSKT